MYYTYMSTYIYIYIHVERDVCMCIYIDIYREREILGRPSFRESSVLSELFGRHFLLPFFISTACSNLNIDVQEAKAPFQDFRTPNPERLYLLFVIACHDWVTKLSGKAPY